MKTIKGKWRYNEGALTIVNCGCTTDFTCSAGNGTQILVIPDLNDILYVIAPQTEGEKAESVYILNDDGEVMEGFEEIDFGETECEVGDTFYAWLTANATELNPDSGTGDDGTGDSGTGDDGTGDSGNGDDGAGDSGTGDTGTGDGTGDTGTGDSGTGEEKTISHIEVDGTVYRIVADGATADDTTAKGMSEVGTLSIAVETDSDTSYPCIGGQTIDEFGLVCLLRSDGGSGYVEAVNNSYFESLTSLFRTSKIVEIAIACTNKMTLVEDNYTLERVCGGIYYYSGGVTDKPQDAPDTTHICYQDSNSNANKYSDTAYYLKLSRSLRSAIESMYFDSAETHTITFVGYR